MLLRLHMRHSLEWTSQGRRRVRHLSKKVIEGVGAQVGCGLVDLVGCLVHSLLGVGQVHIYSKAGPYYLACDQYKTIPLFVARQKKDSRFSRLGLL